MDRPQHALLKITKAGEKAADRISDGSAAVLNVEQSIRLIESSLEIRKDEENGLKAARRAPQFSKR